MNFFVIIFYVMIIVIFINAKRAAQSGNNHKKSHYVPNVPKSGKMVICDTCEDCLREMEQYVWDSKAGRDSVRKEHDHAMDDMRYFAATVLTNQGAPIVARSVARRC